MTTVRRTSDAGPHTSSRHPGSRLSPQLILLVVVMGLLAVAVGVVAACVVFPEPTMWRVAIIGLVIAPAVVPMRALARRTAGPGGGSLPAEAESEV